MPVPTGVRTAARAAICSGTRRVRVIDSQSCIVHVGHLHGRLRPLPGLLNLVHGPLPYVRLELVVASHSRSTSTKASPMDSRVRSTSALMDLSLLAILRRIRPTRVLGLGDCWRARGGQPPCDADDPGCCRARSRCCCNSEQNSIGASARHKGHRSEKRRHRFVQPAQK